MSSFQSSGFHLKIHALHFVRTPWNFFAHFCLFLHFGFRSAANTPAVKLATGPTHQRITCGVRDGSLSDPGPSTTPWCYIFPKAQAGDGHSPLLPRHKGEFFGKVSAEPTHLFCCPGKLQKDEPQEAKKRFAQRNSGSPHFRLKHYRACNSEGKIQIKCPSETTENALVFCPRIQSVASIPQTIKM